MSTSAAPIAAEQAAARAVLRRRPANAD